MHLLEAPSATVREHVFERLANMYPLPASASRAGILAGDRRMIAAWREGMIKDWYY